MFCRAGIRVQAFVPLTDSDGERFSLHLWTWWKDQIHETTSRLTGAPGPWRIETAQYVVITWIALDEEQLDILTEFFERTRREFGLEELYFDHCDVTFAVTRARG